MTDLKKEQVALFRFSIIFPLLDERLGPGERTRLMDEICAKTYEIPHSTKTTISRSSVYFWLKSYQQTRTLAALMPCSRKDQGGCRALDKATQEGLLTLREQEENQKIPLTTLVNKYVRNLAREGEPIPDRIPMDAVYRLFRNEKSDRHAATTEDMRRFEAENCNDIWQLDAMHGPKVVTLDLKNGKNKNVTAKCFAFIDDKSRYITHAQFYIDERAESLIDCFWQAANKCGLPRKLYTDNGSAMRDQRVSLGFADLEVQLSYAKPYRPMGKAKIERFWKTMRDQFLPLLPTENLTIEYLNNELEAWVKEYNTRYHSTLKCSPSERYMNELQAIRPAPKGLPLAFRNRITRKVSDARTVSIEGRLFEVPLGYAGKKIELRYFNLGKVEAFYQDKSIGIISEVNLTANSYAHRMSLDKEE